jgi:pyruvate/2-oxoglutarate dehydrogenase complex dihydrolipoamide dehydrogenase (E3) component
LNAGVRRVRDLGTEREVVIQKGAEEISLRAEMILVALGRKPNLDGLNLEAAGVDYDQKGIKVDDRLRTSRKHVYAAGDATGAFQFTHAAGYEGGSCQQPSFTSRKRIIPFALVHLWTPTGQH